MKIEIIGTPFNGLGEDPNIENPPDGLRQAGLVSTLKENGHIVTDLGNLVGFECRDIRDPETGINDFGLWVDLSLALSQSVEAMRDRRAFPLVLGGDCRMLVGIFLALARETTNSGLIFVDGHGDFHTPDTSPSGDPADMELAVLTGRGPKQITHLSGSCPILNDEDVVVYGIRAWDHIDESNIDVYDKQRMMSVGLEAAVKEGLKPFTERALPAWLHFDVDVLDPQVMPVMFPEPGGFSFEEIHEFVNLVWSSGQIIGLSIACYHPRLDTDGRAGRRLVQLIADVLSR